MHLILIREVEERQAEPVVEHVGTLDVLETFRDKLEQRGFMAVLNH